MLFVRKALQSLLMVFCVVLISCQKQRPVTCDLTQNWQFAKLDSTNKLDWMSAVVPGTVHQDLLRQGLIPDPNVGAHEQDIQWVEKESWAYRTTFSLTNDDLNREGALLQFEGLDTYAEVYLNNALVLTGKNMFVGYELPVKEYLKIGENELKIIFRSPVEMVQGKIDSAGFQYPADNDHSSNKASVYTRKAPYHFGWDWGLRMVTSGVYRPVRLLLYDKATINDLYVKQKGSVNNGSEKLNAAVVVKALSDCTANLVVNIELNGEIVAQSISKTPLKRGENKLDVDFTLDHPDYWMPNGWGEQPLYTVNALLKSGEDVLAEKSTKIGIRTIQVVTEQDSIGEPFYFVVNGEPMYAKGANYIPNDLLLPRVGEEKYRRLFEDMKASNFNMIRVWGGGVYEDDLFYQLADEYGILVWQDFMFACTSYPSDTAFLHNVAQEADYNIRRLRNHACLAMWCGNNEIEEALKYWGWKKANNYADEVFDEFWEGYDKLFRKLLPEKINLLDSGRYYVHSSPYFANWGRPASWAVRDLHDWGVWHGRLPFESFETRLSRFSSEFGFQAFPEMKTIRTFAEDKDLSLESEVMKVHQKSYIGNSAIRDYMERYYKVPEKFDDFVYVGLVLQGMGMRIGFDAQRRNRPYCMGTLYWQLNDCWPVVSWSSIDWYGNWKALQYQAQRAFAPLALSAIERKDSLKGDNQLVIYGMNDELSKYEGLELHIQQIDFDGKKLKEMKLPVELSSNSSSILYTDNIKNWITPEQRSHTLLKYSLVKGDSVLTSRLFYFLFPKDLDLPKAKVEVMKEMKVDRCIVTLKSDKLAKDIFIEVPQQGARFSDNFFDLLPGEAKRVEITFDKQPDTDVEVHIRQLSDTY